MAPRTPRIRQKITEAGLADSGGIILNIYAVINRGFGGARLTDVPHYANRIALPYAPKTFLLNASGYQTLAGLLRGQSGEVIPAISACARTVRGSEIL